MISNRKNCQPVQPCWLNSMGAIEWCLAAGLQIPMTLRPRQCNSVRESSAFPSAEKSISQSIIYDSLLLDEWFLLNNGLSFIFPKKVTWQKAFNYLQDAIVFLFNLSFLPFQRSWQVNQWSPCLRSCQRPSLRMPCSMRCWYSCKAARQFSPTVLVGIWKDSFSSALKKTN